MNTSANTEGKQTLFWHFLYMNVRRNGYSKYRFDIFKKPPLHLPQTHAYGNEFNFGKLETLLGGHQLQCHYPWFPISGTKLHTEYREGVW